MVVTDTDNPTQSLEEVLKQTWVGIYEEIGEETSTDAQITITFNVEPRQAVIEVQDRNITIDTAKGVRQIKKEVEREAKEKGKSPRQHVKDEAPLNKKKQVSPPNGDESGNRDIKESILNT